MAEYTPMLNHYFTIKEKYPDILIFYRLGDFYELFFEDAKIASRELDLVLTSRNAGNKEKAPMCGVPHHAVNNYLQRLISKGYKVAIVEQLEDPSLAKGLVKRDVVKIITPGTLIDDNQSEKVSIYVAAIHNYKYGLAISLAEMATFETKGYYLEYDENELIQFIRVNNILELIVDKEFSKSELCKAIGKKTNCLISIYENDEIKDEYQELVKDIDDHRMINSFGRLINYLENTQKTSLSNLSRLKIIRNDDYLYMDYATRLNLELIMPLRSSSGNNTLWNFLDHCRSSLGSRTLKRWIEYPLVNKDEIIKRQNVIEWLNKNYLIKDELKEKLDDVYDLERIISKIALGSVNAKDLIRLEKTLSSAPLILGIFNNNDVLDDFKNVDDCRNAKLLISGVFVDDPPLLTNEGKMFKEGYNKELDELRNVQKNANTWLASYEAKEKERTGIKNLKIGYNRVSGYYIEISKGNLSLVKDEFGYIRRQTLTTGERFITTELKEKEDDILHASEKSIKLESELFKAIVDKLKLEIDKLKALSISLGMIDAYYALSKVSDKNNYVKPAFNDDRILNIESGRHPILESINNENPYISNDIKMDENTDILIITGPNMGGKSTYMRQTVLIIIMAQIGCFVPAKKASLPIFDKIFTRIGASDDLMAGQSTFMVEMVEANHALKNATKNSLILFDEIGRGTATYDGMALAQAILEYIATGINAKTLFSTHYHELVGLQEVNSNIKNVHVTVDEKDGDITFLYKVKDGAQDKSYGINVAKLANLPKTVLDRATLLLKVMENQNDKKKNVQGQMIMMEKVPEDLQKIKDILKEVDVNNMTPMEALSLVSDLKNINKDEEN